MSAHPTLQATLPQALENAIMAVEFLRGAVQYASPVESIVIMGLLEDAVCLSNAIETLTMAIREEAQ